MNIKSHQLSLAVTTALLGCVLLPSFAHAQCKQWDASGVWDIIQSDGVHVRLFLDQKFRQTQFNGTAENLQTSAKVPVMGSIVGDRFKLSVPWNKDSVSTYVGTIDAGGGLTGTVTNSKDPLGLVRAPWSSNRPTRCMPTEDELRRDYGIPEPASGTAESPQYDRAVCLEAIDFTDPEGNRARLEANKIYPIAKIEGGFIKVLDRATGKQVNLLPS